MVSWRVQGTPCSVGCSHAAGGMLSMEGEWGSPARLGRELQGLWGFVLSNLSVGRSLAGETRLYCEVLER